MLMNDTALLTGVTGYIGGRLLRHFEEAGRLCAVLNTQDLADRVASDYGEDSASL